MGARFLHLATQGDSSGLKPVMLFPAMVWIIIILIVMGVALAVMSRFARRRLMNEPRMRSRDESVDPWAEAGRRIGEPGKKPSRPGRPPNATDFDDGTST